MRTHLYLESENRMSLTMESQLDSRLTVRVLRVWKELAAAGLPKRSQVDPRDFGADWSNCVMIALNPIVAKSRFSYVGSGLQTFISVPYKRKTFAKLQEETLLKLLNQHIPQVVADKMPLKFADSAQHNGKSILYRTVLLPLSEIGKQVDGILAGLTYREVSVEKQLPAAERAVAHRHGEGNSQHANATRTTARG